MNNKILSFVLAILIPISCTAAPTTPNTIDNSVYFKSQIKDSPQCSLNVKNEKIIFPSSVTNPATSCPDAFAWKKFLEAIKAEFWKNWAYDAYNWPNNPLALCSSKNKSGACCTPNSKTNPGYKDTNDPGKNCPYYPGDHLTSGKQAITIGKHSFKQHFNQTSVVQTSIINQLDPGRVIRQEMAEVVYRNRTMWSYTFKNNLYNKKGLANKFNMIQTAIADNAPYRPVGVRIEYPIGSVMFKSDWLHEEEAKKLGLDKSKHPYIKQYMKSPVGDNDPGRFRKGIHYLVAITAASKDLPKWHWYAIEHVDNLGRCDYTGCNDSFGYTSPDTIPDKFSKNFIKPLTKSDGLKSASPIFVTGKRYPSGKITSALKNVYKKLGIATSVTKNLKQPSVSNKAWLSYRLKGTQTEFVTADGINTVMGNSITEGGFVNSSSCMSCHSQASVNAKGNPGVNSVGFTTELNLFGYRRSANGAPQPSWFYQTGTNTPQAVQTDFVWGILFAK